MVTGSRNVWPESSINLWDRASRVAPRALLELARVSSDVGIGLEKARLGKVGTGGFDPWGKDDVAGNTGSECVTFEAGEAGPTTACTAGLSDVFSLPLAVAPDPSTTFFSVSVT
jgi:hypothetical protein